MPHVAAFTARLRASLRRWAADGTRCAWLKVPPSRGEFISVLHGEGFGLHHADAEGVMLSRWLSAEADQRPGYASHFVGVGAVVTNRAGEILLVQERFDDTGLAERWKIPGGLVEEGEGVEAAAVREVREETGVETEFVSMIAVREKHGYQFGKDDMYLVARLRPLTETVSKATQELAEVAWKPLGFFTSLTEGQTYPTQLAIAKILRESGNDAAVTDWPREVLDGTTRAVAAEEQAQSFWHWAP